MPLHFYEGLFSPKLHFYEALFSLPLHFYEGLFCVKRHFYEGTSNFTPKKHSLSNPSKRRDGEAYLVKVLYTLSRVNFC